MKDFFSADEEDFERDLTDAAGSGFFLQRPFLHPLLPSPKTTRILKKDKLQIRTEKSLQNIHDMLIEEMRGRGSSEKEIEDYFAIKPLIEDRYQHRRKGYAGWLVTHPSFHESKALFLKHWRTRVVRDKQFPMFPRSFFGEAQPRIPKRLRPYYTDYLQFYRDWSLEEMLTWDLPLPMHPELVTYKFYEKSLLGNAGVTLFIPWYLLADKDLKLDEVTEHSKLIDSAPGLNKWLNRPKKWGHQRYAIMFQLYVFLELALKPRYGEHLRKRVKHLDAAFGRFFSSNNQRLNAVEPLTDSIKKIRLKMNQRLKECIRS